MNRGFTLVELLVVLVMAGILASVALRQYSFSVESARASQAVALLVEVGSANRLRFDPQHGIAPAVGLFTNADCATGMCLAAGPACQLVHCKLLANRDWNNHPYVVYGCDGVSTPGCCAAGSVACVSRRNGASPGTNATPYKDWVYRMSDSGAITGVNTAGGAAPPAP